MRNNSNNGTKHKKKNGPFYNFCYDFVKITGIVPMFLWLRPKIYYPFGKPDKKGAVMVTCNHRSFMDPMTVHMVLPWRHLNCLATKDLYDTKLKKLLFTLVHCIIVDKDNFSLSSFHEVVGRLEDGRVVVIFPEGQVNKDKNETLLAFKSGAVLMAHKAGAPILPMYVVKREKWYHRQRIVVGQRVDLSSLLGKMPSMEDMTRATDLLREKEVELREYFEALPIYKKLNVKENTVEEKERTGSLI